MLQHALEPLESRRLLSVTIAESEPNTGPAAANPVPRLLETPVHYTGAIDAPGDLDWIKIDLKKGDVFGASLKGGPGLDGMIHFGNAAGQLLIHNDDSFLTGTFLPPSPLPRSADDIRDPEIYYVISQTGTYYLQLSAYTDPDTGDTSTGAYDLEIVTARPGMESKPVGSKQIVFLDFDGGDVTLDPGYMPHLEPLITSLSQWGLGPSDLNKVIRETVKRTTEKLSSFIAANGLNGDYAKSGTPGEFGIDIRNSLDNPDPGDNPLASKVIIGLTDNDRLAHQDIGVAPHIDVGNFQQDDDAAVSTNFIAGLLAGFPIAKPGNKTMVINFAAEYMSVIISHEFGHLTGAFHTQFTTDNSFNGEPVNLMDKDIRVPMGADLVFGTADDITMHFGVDQYDPNEIYVGINDTLNTVAFGLSTGTVRRHGPGPAVVGTASLVSSFRPDATKDDKTILELI